MTTVVFGGEEDSVVQVTLLVAALSEWLKEQPPATPVHGECAQFFYRPDGTLDSVRTTRVGE